MRYDTCMTTSNKCRECSVVLPNGQARCNQCMARNRQRYASRMARRKSLNLCRCGQPMVPLKRSCQICLDKQKESRSRRTKRVQLRLVCWSCGQKPVEGTGYCQTHLDASRLDGVRRNNDARNKVFDHYGRCCASCGETIQLFLTIDHIANNGAEHRRASTHGISGNVLYKWLVRNSFPEGFQTLCFNCNMAKAVAFRAQFGVPK